MLSLNLLYEPTIFISFISAIQDLGKKLDLGLITQIEGTNITIFIRTLEKVFGILITYNAKSYLIYQRFLDFATTICDNWLKTNNIEVNNARELFEKRKEIEEQIKLLVDSDSWEIHQIKEKERELLASKSFIQPF